MPSHIYKTKILPKRKKKEKEKPELKEAFSSFASITPATSSALILQQDANNYKLLMWKITNKIIKFNNEPLCAGSHFAVNPNFGLLGPRRKSQNPTYIQSAQSYYIR